MDYRRVMSINSTEIDVLSSPPQQRDGRYMIPEDAKVLPTMASLCECELVVNEEGMAMVLFTKTLPEGIHWIEYDMDLSMLTFVTWSGSIMGLGMKIHAPFRKYLKMAKEIMMVQMSEDKQSIVVMYPADVVVRNIGI